MPAFANFSWTSKDVLNVLPQGLALAFVSGANLLLTSRAVEHFQGKHKHLKRAMRMPNWAPMESRIFRWEFSERR